MSYMSRVADADLLARLRRAGAVLIEGAKGTGKTATASQAAQSVVHVDTDENVAAFMQADPARVLAGPTPRLLDEWQHQPRLWDLVRRAVDERNAPGQFILTGSATPDKNVRRHSGVGRFSVMRLRPMSLWEQQASTGEVSLEDLRHGGEVSAQQSAVSLDSLAAAVVRGGWPATVGRPDTDAAEYVLDYLEVLAEADICEVDDVRRDPARVRRLLRSLARHTATDATLARIVRDVEGEHSTLNRDTAASYLVALERLMITDPQPAWQTALKDSATLRKAAKRHLADPSLAAAAMGASQQTLVREPKTLGSLVESMAVRDLRVYAAGKRGSVYHYRDSAGREIDAVIQYPDGWIACEIKLGTGAVEQAAASLKRTVANIDTQTVGEPDALVIVTGLGPGYRRPDGIAVVPLACLKP